MAASATQPDDTSHRYVRAYPYYSSTGHSSTPDSREEFQISSRRYEIWTSFSYGERHQFVRLKPTRVERLRSAFRRLRHGREAAVSNTDKKFYEVNACLVGYTIPSLFCFSFRRRRQTASQFLLLQSAKDPRCPSPPPSPRAAADDTPPPISVSTNQDTATTTTTHVTIDYQRYLISQLSAILSMPFYWGVIDRYQAEAVLENKAEGSFLLRDSAQEDFVFSVSFRRFNRTLHARVGQRGHQFSFDPHDASIFAADSLPAMLEHYKTPTNCMFYEPMCCSPVPRTTVFSLQDLARASLVTATRCYDDMANLPVPRHLVPYLRYYHYKVPVKVNYIDSPPPASSSSAVVVSAD